MDVLLSKKGRPTLPQLAPSQVVRTELTEK